MKRYGTFQRWIVLGVFGIGIGIWTSGSVGLAQVRHDVGRVIPDRDTWQKPEEVIRAIGLKPGQVVADLGAGTGYFTFRLAEAVRPGGRVLAQDISVSALRSILRQVPDAGSRGLQRRRRPGLAGIYGYCHRDGRRSFHL